MRAVLLVSALLLAGCAVPAGVPDPQPAPSDGSFGVQIGMPPRGLQVPPPSPAVVEPTADPEAPPVTLGGAPSHALPVLVRERFGPRDETRTPCGGAIVATAPEAADPRLRMGEARYVESYELVDEAGKTWVTDHYALETDGNTTGLWVSNVGGAAWSPDDGHASCPAWANGTKEYNVLLHARGIERVALYFSPAGRPAEPEARSWAGPE